MNASADTERTTSSEGTFMSDQPSRAGRVRRIIPWLGAVLVGGAGTLAVATPSQAATCCEVACHPVFRDRNDVELLAFKAGVDVGDQRTTGWRVQLVYEPD